MYYMYDTDSASKNDIISLLEDVIVLREQQLTSRNIYQDDLGNCPSYACGVYTEAHQFENSHYIASCHVTQLAFMSRGSAIA